MDIKIKDNSLLRVFQFESLSCMDWVFLTEDLVGVIAKVDEELAYILRIVTGQETAELGSKDLEFTAKLLKGVLKAISSLSKEEKIKIYDRIFTGLTHHTPEGGVLFVSCETLNTIFKDPHNFYILVFECLKAHYTPFFLLARESIKGSGHQEEISI